MCGLYIQRVMDKGDKDIREVTNLLPDLFHIDAVYRRGPHEVAYSLGYRFNPTKAVKLLRDRLETGGYKFSVDASDDNVVLTVDPRRRLRIPRTNIILFLVTLFTVYVVPVFARRMLVAESWSEAVDLTRAALADGEGLVFTAAMISILFVHEMGHFIASRRRGIVTSLPYFIPAPNIIGTFGAIIKSKSPFWNRRDLIEVGAAGPIAGWIVAVAWLWFGLQHSQVLPQPEFRTIDLLFSMDGESLLMRLSTWLTLGPAPEGHFYRLSEAAFAGWVGLLVTAINLLPIGQLDGGHVVYGLGRRRQHILGMLATGGLILLGLQSPVWWFFAAFGLLFGMKHPPTLDDEHEPSTAAKVMGWTALLILVLSFTPVPFR